MKTIKTKKFAQLKDSNILKSIIQSYIDFLNSNPFEKSEYIVSFFETLIDGINVEEIYGDKLKESGRDVVQHIRYLDPIPNVEIEEKQRLIKNIYDKHYDVHDPVRNSLFYMACIPEVDEWLDKNSKSRNYGR